jgi:hypothetical protein
VTLSLAPARLHLFDAKTGLSLRERAS